jgi:endoglucanase
MLRPRWRRPFATLLATALIAAAASLGVALPATAEIKNGTRFYVPEPEPDALAQIADLRAAGHRRAAAKIKAMINVPTGVWVESGSANAARQQVRQVTREAARERRVPLLVLYNVPFRDCAQYSAGGATSVEEYKAWIDGVVKGIGTREVVVALEPDGLGIIPWYTNLDGQLEWCQPAEADAEDADTERFEMLNYAVDELTALPNTSVYLDGTHSAWLNVGEITDRLLKAGVRKADGFFLNASNYQWTQNSEQYGTWISSCIAYVTKVNPGDYANCGNQYWNGGPANGNQGVALDPAKIWSDTATDPTANTAGINSRYAALLGTVKPTKTFIIDTSRNGRGPWTPTAEQTAAFPDPQTWCNPPRRGLGPRPTTRTGTRLADAYLWIKVPGESDGQCSRGLGTGDEVVDPIWGQIDPDAGVWFPEQALELARLANPPLRTRN